MYVTGGEAWITSAVEDKNVNKAIILAGSLRRVCTTKKLVVVTALAVSQELREKLKVVFDLVVYLEQESPNGFSLEDYAKAQAFSLMLFNKCVYLSPNTLVLKNCDDMFEKYGKFAVRTTGDKVDLSVYLFTPSLEYSRALEKVLYFHENDGKDAGYFLKYFHQWIQNNIPNPEKLEEKYNSYLYIGNGNKKSLTSKVTVANFVGAHPLDIPDGKLTGLGIIEKVAIDLSRKIYDEDVKPKNADASPTLNTEVYKNEPIAIVGMSFRLPGGNNVDDLWQLLIEGKEGIKPVPPHRWTRENSHLPCKNRKVEGGFLDFPLDDFDSKFFGVSPKEAEFLDPQQRLLHEVTWEALEDAMINPLKLKGTKTGVFIGSWVHDYKDMCQRTTDVDFFRIYMGNSIAATAARLSHFLETTGPSIATESGCSSAMAALDMACKSLRNGDSTIALAGGVNLLLHPYDYKTLDVVLSPDGRCKTFDANADGFARAEGCAVFLLKRLSDATRDNNRIWGLVRGTALTQEGISKSLGTPTIQCESLAMELALKDANVDPKQVSYIEAHGTGTSVGDPMEIAAITKAYFTNQRSSPLVIGSVKTNVGHTESVSGMTGIIKVLLAMQNEEIPPHLNLETLNPEINLDALPAQIPIKALPWPRMNNKPRIAGVSSFGISGTDGHAIIQEPPRIDPLQMTSNDKRPLHVMTISAKSQKSFEKLLLKYQEKFTSKATDDSGFANVAYSANTGRAAFNHRAVIIAEDFQKASKILTDKSYKQGEISGSGKSLCFLFTGQGSQYPKMAATLYTTSPVFRDCFDRCDKILTKRYGINLKQVLWEQSDADELSRTLYSQTSIFCVEYCLLNLWMSWGVKAGYVMGHSLGEFAAAVAAGAVDFEDALMLVAERSQLIDNLPRGKMLVIKADKKSVDQAIKRYKEIEPKFWADYAALNSSDQTVLAGDSQLIEGFAEYCGEKSLKCIVLAATHAFHSRHMDPMLEAYRKVAQTVKPIEADNDSPKFISGMEGKLIDIKEIDAEYWVRHTREKVSFIDACKTAESEGCTLFLEIGPHPVLSALAMQNIDSHTISCFPSLRRQEGDWITMLDSLAKLYLSEWKGEIDWVGFDRYYKRNRVDLPFYPFNRKPVWRPMEPMSPSIHPLIGSILPTATGETIFENKITIRNTHFVLDHVIGSTVVFPGAGFLEMCLAGGHAAVQGASEELHKPRRPVVLKSLKITTPLALYESTVCKLQTLIVLEDDIDDEGDMGYAVSIHKHSLSEDSCSGQWVSHANAKFLPIAPKHLMEQSITAPINIGLIQSTWERSDNRGFYEKLPEVGLRFGPKFQSLEMGWKSENAMLLSVRVPEDNNSYLIHPVVADAMIQATMIWTTKEKVKKKLQVPIHIGEFVWLQSSNSERLYIHCKTNDQGKAECVLVDEQGTPLACMRDVELIETTVKLVEGMIHQQSAAMPKLWEEIWRYLPGPLQTSYDFVASPFETKTTLTTEEIAKLDVGSQEKPTYENMCNLARLYFLNAYYQLGWKPQQGVPFSTRHLMQLLPNVELHLTRYTRFFLRSLSEVGVLKIVSEVKDTFVFEKSPPSQEEIWEGLKYITRPDEATRVDHRLTTQVGKSLSQVLTGKVSALQLLFPNDPTMADAAGFYTFLSDSLLSLLVSLYNDVVDRGIKNGYDHYMNSGSRQGPPLLRILEVGAGTGILSKSFIDMIYETGKPFEYYYTDISAAFFVQAEKRFEKYLKHIVFKKLDIEEDPMAQGFCPGYFDIIFAGEVLHVAKDIRKSLRLIRSLLKAGGLIQIQETVAPDPRITFFFGLLEGYWRFEDINFRPYHTTLTVEKWKDALEQTGFEKVSPIKYYNDVHGIILARATMESINTSLVFQGKPDKYWIILGDEQTLDLTQILVEKLLSVKRKAYVIKKPTVCSEKVVKELLTNVVRSAEEYIEGVLYLWGISANANDRDQTQFSLPFVTLLQIIMRMSTIPRIYVVTQGMLSILEGSEVDNPTPGCLSGIVRSAANEFAGAYIANLDLEAKQQPVEQAQEIFSNIWWVESANRVVAFRNGQRLCARFGAARIKNNEPLSLPAGSDRFQLILPKSRLISDLEFGILDKYVLNDNEVEVEIKAMALNFRDVFTVLKPIPEFENFNAVGLDFIGVVKKVGSKVTTRKVGDRVMGMSTDRNLALPSHTKQEEQLLVPIPDNMTFAEGVTLPAVFLTALHCLANVAEMKRGDTLLIHTASGGVGLCAIQLAKRIGANIIATAGSPRKRNYLHGLGIDYVFNSRTTDFEKQILEITKGRGVDIVLNSITGEGFKEASLNCLAKNGKFIEMSKLNIWKAEEVNALRPDVFYRIVDLTTLEKVEREKLSMQLKEYLHSDFIRPIAYERFDAVNIRGALNYLQKAKHIGKIVCMMPEFKVEKSKVVSRTKLFNEDSTYLVTGGLGGIGFEIVKWMLGNGAKHIAIASRGNPKPELATQIDFWNKGGKHVKAFAFDIGDFEQCRCLFNEIETSNGFPKLRGIMHAAGVLADAPLEDMTWSSFEHTFNPKVKGTWNLHDLTKNMLLEHFVLFSSMSAILGTPMQANHCGSNSFEDTFASYRRSQGLPATTINWGNWGEVGVATEIDYPGVRPISTSQGLLVLEAVLTTQTSHVSVLNIESFSMITKIFSYLKYYLDDKRLFGEVKSAVLVNSDEFWNAVDAAEEREGKLLVFKTYVKIVLRNILKMDADEPIDDITDFHAMGVDSLMMLEMKNGMQNLLGTRMTITPAQLKGCNNTEMLANRLVEILEGDEGVKNIPSQEELKVLIREDSVLPEHIQVSEEAKANFSPNIKSALVTGATGTLAPYLLRELSKCEDIKRIVCIIRKSGKGEIRERLIAKLQALDLLDEIDMDKVECLEGDLTSSKFGLTDEVYDDLATSIDAIFHCAVRADHTTSYWKAPEAKKHEMRTVNVVGTVRVLEFAVESKLKAIFHASAMVAMTGEGDDEEYSEGWQSISAFDDIPARAGYAISKFISEQLMKQAIERGVPIKAFRFPHIAGDSRTGRCDYDSNHVVQRWLVFMKLQQMYDFPTPLAMMAVDHCAKLSLDIFLNQKAPSDIYNILQKVTSVEQSFIEIAEEFGISIEAVPYSEFVKKLKYDTGTSLLAYFKDAYEEEEEAVLQAFIGSKTKFVRRYIEDNSSCLDSSKMINFAPIYSEVFDETYYDVVKRDLLFIKDQGVFDKVGIKYKK